MRKQSLKGVLTLALALLVTLALAVPVLADSSQTVTVSTADELTKAVAAGGSVKLGADITQSITIADGVSVTLDLNGHTLTNTSGSDTITVDCGGTLKVVDTGSAKNGRVDNVTHGYAALFNSGTATLSGGDFDRSKEDGSTNTYYSIVNHGTMTINDGTTVEDASGHSALIDNGYYNVKSTDSRLGYVSGKNAQYPTLTINGGTFTGGRYNVKNDDNSRLIINGGTFKDGGQSAIINFNVATINGGTFTSSSNAVILNDRENSTVDRGDLTITGGTFTTKNYGKNVESDDSYIFVDANDSAQKTSDVKITGGTFYGQLEYLSGETETQLEISGGTFSAPLTSDESHDIQTSYTEVKNDDGTYSIVLLNAWTTKLSISNWTVTEKAGTPSAAARYGTVTYTYYDQNKKKLSAKPTTPGTWYIQASVAGGRDSSGNAYSNLTSDLVKFKISAGNINVKAVSSGSTATRLTWSKVKGATSHTVYYAKCGSTMKKLKTVRTTSLTRKGLRKGSSYKYKVVANATVSGRKTVLARSYTMHSIAGNYNSRYTVAKKVTASKASLTLTAGSTGKVSAKTAKYKTGRSLLPSSHAAKYRYTSSDTRVATVSADGKVTAKSAGTCKIRILAQNGVYDTVKVTVK